MKQFNINDYQGKYAMHCKTEEEAKDFCRVMHEAGRTWNGNKSYKEWIGCLGYDVVYYFNEGVHSRKDSRYEEGYTILNWSDFMQHEFTKGDLRDGMVAICANGERYILLCGGLRNSDMRGWFGGFSKIDEDFKNTGTGGSEFDIVCVCISSASVLEDWCNDKYLTPVWQRPEVTVMTMDEIKKKLGIEGELRIKEA